MLTNSQLNGLKALAAAKRDETGREFVDRTGRSNLAARVRATRKGAKLVVNGAERGVDGVDGNRFHVIRRGVSGDLWCSCPACRFSGFKGCKHIDLVKSVAPALFDSGTHISAKQDVIVYDFEACGVDVSTELRAAA